MEMGVVVVVVVTEEEEVEVVEESAAGDYPISTITIIVTACVRRLCRLAVER